MRFYDSREPAADLAMDQAIELAWTHLKDGGLHASSPALDDAKTSRRVAQCLHITHQELTSEARPNHPIRVAQQSR